MDSPLTFPETPSTKRIVIQRGDLMTIMGWVEGAPPEFIPELGVSLVQVKPRYAIYKEPSALPSGKLGEFHPGQQ